MTIEYDEEVKLHDGEMIWVHITRYYILSSAALGDPGGLESSYKPQKVKISWDTGFEGVGRKSVYFKRQVFVMNKINNEWYVYGASDKHMTSSYGQSTSCNDVGTSYFNGANCLVKIDSSGKFLKPSEAEISKLIRGNILYSYSFDETKSLENKKLSWQQKLSIQSGKPKKYQLVNKQLFPNKSK
ncbi:hypothetical protein [Psychrobacter sp. T6-5]|uniref:hypothetical protein n=1 Tax=Psychrobacter sp. T6-5 TaxID=3457451 RepID=UPI003FD18B34